jgi:hypothetical protein
LERIPAVLCGIIFAFTRKNPMGMRENRYPIWSSVDKKSAIF